MQGYIDVENEEERIEQAKSAWEREKKDLSQALLEMRRQRDKLQHELATAKLEQDRQMKEIEYQRSTLSLFRERMRGLDRDKILSGQKSAMLERLESVFETVVKEYNFQDAEEAYRYVEKLKFAQTQLMEDLSHTESQLSKKKEELGLLEKARDKEVAQLQKEVDEMTLEHRQHIDKRDTQIDRLRGDQRRQKSMAQQYETLKNAINAFWAKWRGTSQGENEEHVMGRHVALTDPMEIIPALDRCFNVHADTEASARYTRLVTGAINTLWRTHFSEKTEIKSVAVEVVDHASTLLTDLKKQVSDLQFRNETDKQERRDAIEHLRASERARRKLQLALQHCKDQMRLNPRDRRPDFGLIREAEEAGQV